MGAERKMAQDGAKEPEECKKRQRKRGPAPETHTEWMWNDSASPISLGCQGCCGEVGASDQAIQAFKHPQAFSASSPDELTTVYRCFCWTLIALMLLPPPSFPSLQLYFLSHSLKYTDGFLSFPLPFSLINPPFLIAAPLATDGPIGTLLALARSLARSRKERCPS